MFLSSPVVCPINRSNILDCKNVLFEHNVQPIGSENLVDIGILSTVPIRKKMFHADSCFFLERTKNRNLVLTNINSPFNWCYFLN